MIHGTFLTVSNICVSRRKNMDNINVYLIYSTSIEYSPFLKRYEDKKTVQFQ
jgi:hypothetical protein